MKNVRFLPWVGQNYAQGFDGLRTLILGESHYQWNPDKPINSWSTLTVECIQEQLDGVTFAFWTKVATALLGRKPTLDEKKQFWNSVAFYNYVQESAGFGPRVRPEPKSWELSKIPFSEVLEELKPNFIVALGNRLWEMLPDFNGYEGPQVENARQKRTWIYSYSGGSALLYSIRHPSSGFSPLEWHKNIAIAREKAKAVFIKMVPNGP